MTETVSGPGALRSSGVGTHRAPLTGKGIRIERVYTTAGVHPYDEVTWERRDVVQTNWKTGDTVFEQRGVEFPDFWSVNASTIVTTKYFRGAVGSARRESSLRQLIDRVVLTYVDAGTRHGYFATQTDADVFEHELTWMLLHQVFSFNSPVWFNVGTSSPQQVSACQPYDALVSTPEGLVPIGQLVEHAAVGTKVYDAHGLTRILAVKANGVKDVLRLHTKAGYTLDVTADHLVWRADDAFGGEFVEAGGLHVGDLLLHVEPEVGGTDRQTVEIARIESIGAMEVYDIETESGEYLSGNLRVHNCFILAVDDSMDSILNWYREEGLIFKGGSGAGLNISRIRSSKELLRSSGGTASGPVSFMRGADASAGTIKSGGATRRAAKMVVLDVDHPDIEEFVQTKAREEDKIRVLRDAGFDMDLGGRDIVSVQYQNANNSVRVSDEFMRAVEQGDSWGLTARTTGEVIETIDAKNLWRQIAEAAWACADPGVQYDSTINDWHTTPESGRITASNPCFPADQRVVTDKGLVRIGDLVARAAQGEQFEIYTNDVTSKDAPTAGIVATRPVQYMVTGTNEIMQLKFSDGSRLRCTPRHRVWTANRGWVHAEELTKVDQVVRSFHQAFRPMASWALPSAAQQVARAATALSLPEKWTEDLGHLVGWVVGDGCVTDKTMTLVYGSGADQVEILPRHAALLQQLTGLDAKPSVQANGTLQLRSSKHQVIEFMRALGVSKGRASTKVLPESLFEAPEAVLTAFLRGLFDADGCVVDQEAKGTRYVGLGSRSDALLRSVQELLASLGIGSRIYRTGTKEESFTYTRKDGTVVRYGSDGPFYDLRISGRSIQQFANRVGFTLSAKAAKLRHVIESHEFYAVRETVHLISRESQGFETTYNLTEPRNHSYIVNGVVVANCSEYVHLDNSSCNLASLNLLAFLTDDGSFDAVTFAKAVQIIITAMDISICFADFPTDKIAETTRAYRQLGIGYCNLGALLMASGLAYDSDGGRALAASITSLMTATSYKRSAELAAVVGAYEGYARNASAHTRVMRKHQAANDAVRTVHQMDRDVHELASAMWDECISLGTENGWRNAQASVLAPTGTISFMLDADTTGIEPDFSLVKFKKLVGGGSMQIVNQTVPRALAKLGYAEETSEAIVEYIAEHGHVVDAPGLRPEHYEVFDCAMGERAIKPMGHMRMMAAAQPMLSGAISKTVNVPESATVEEVADMYYQGWKLGLKAIAVYRDNCKVGQPLSDGRAKKADAEKPAKAEVEAEPVTVVVERPTRKRLPKSRPSRTTSFTVGGAEGYLTAGSYPDDGLGEVFLKLGKQGSTLAGVMDAFSMAISISLQYGVPLETYVSKFTNMKFEPAGLTDDPDIRMSQSIMDYIFRRLALDYLPFEQRSALGIYSAEERQRQLETGSYEAAPEELAEIPEAESLKSGDAPAAEELAIEVDASVDADSVIAETAKPAPATTHTSAELFEAITGVSVDAPLCFTCGTKMRPAGSCFVCEGCGSTSGCS